MGIVLIPGLPPTLRDIVSKLYRYGYRLYRQGENTWLLTLPGSDRGMYITEDQLFSGLAGELRAVEKEQGTLQLFTQFDTRWGKTVYGNKSTDTTMKEAGCGPTSLAIVIKYLMENDCLTEGDETVCKTAVSISPVDTAKYAASHGRVSGHGTAGDAMVKGISGQWAGYDGTRVSLDEAVFYLQQGKLIIFLCKSCKGYGRNAKLSEKPKVTYGGHYMVLSGVEGANGPDQLFSVMDPGRNENKAMHFIRRKELEIKTGGFWWVFKKEEPAMMVCLPGEY